MLLVTGGAGFVGTNLIKRLLEDGHKVVSLDNYTTGKKENEQKGGQYFDVDLVQTDNYDFFMDNPDGVFHLAALARIQPSFKHPQLSFNSNALGTQNLLEWVREKQCPLVYAGSSSVHSDKYANPYTFTKHLGEEIIRMYSRLYDIPTIITRFYNVYGENQATEGAYCNVLGIFQRLYNKGKPLTITGDGEQRRDFTYVGDIVDGLVRCGEAHLDVWGNKDVNGQSFELGNGNNRSINELANAFGENYPTKYIEARDGEMRETLNTDTKAQDVLGWKPNGDIIKFIKENYILDK